MSLVVYGQAWGEAKQGSDHILDEYFENYFSELTQSAVNGDVSAQADLCKSYFGREDYVKAIKWCKTAAKNNDARSQNLLGFMYENGQGLPRHYRDAVKWYAKSAEQGHATAQHNLGEMYEDGIGVEQDYVQAHMWYNLSGFSASNRDILAEKMTAAEVSEAQNLAIKWADKHP